MSVIVQLYLKKVKDDYLELEDVPPRWREEVEKELEKLRQNENNEET